MGVLGFCYQPLTRWLESGGGDKGMRTKDLELRSKTLFCEDIGLFYVGLSVTLNHDLARGLSYGKRDHQNDCQQGVAD